MASTAESTLLHIGSELGVSHLGNTFVGNLRHRRAHDCLQSI